MRRAWGLLRSLVIYYGQPWKRRRMRAFYAQVVRPGGLCFDVGAHAGNRVAAFTSLGARVVALEPQPAFFRLLERLYGGREDVILRQEGVAAHPGNLTLHISSAHPTVSTFSEPFIDAVSPTDGFRGVTWDTRVEVPVTTLDALCEAHGEPDFCKIDVEGFEAEVLAGLTRPIRALSFEFLPASREVALACLDHLDRLGDYELQATFGEDHEPQFSSWLPTDSARAWLEALPPDGRSGDLTARLRGASVPHA